MTDIDTASVIHESQELLALVRPDLDDDPSVYESNPFHGVEEPHRNVDNPDVDLPPAPVGMRIERLDRFIASEEHASESLVAGPADGETIMAADTTMLWYGGDGASKSTAADDFASHAAAGIDWLCFPISRPLRICIIENEGSRGRYRLKLARKAATWDGPPFLERVYVYSEPWGEFTFGDTTRCAELGAFIDQHEIDLLICGPLAELGAKGAGTPDDVTEFSTLVARFRSRLDKALAVLILHHENKGQDISGAWGRWPDTTFRFRLDGRERTRVWIRKARHSSRAHGANLTLKWLPDTYGFQIVESDLDDSAGERAQGEVEALDWIVAYVTEHHAANGSGVARGKAETAYHEAHDGRGRNLARRVIDRELALAAEHLAGTRTGEASPPLATGPGATRNGTYLYPFGYAPSPLAAVRTGETGETTSPPLQLDPSRHSPPLREEAAAGEKGGEGDPGDGELECSSERHTKHARGVLTSALTGGEVAAAARRERGD